MARNRKPNGAPGPAGSGLRLGDRTPPGHTESTTMRTDSDTSVAARTEADALGARCSDAANPFRGLTRAEALQRVVGEVELVREKGAHMRLIESQGVRAVMKDFAGRRLHTRLFWGPFLIRREAESLRRLAGLDGVPRLYAVVDRLALVIEWVEGMPCNRLRPGDLDSGFFEALSRTIHAIHARGVAHGDLRAASNVIRRPDGRPCVVDFGASVARGGRPRWLCNWLFGRLRSSDLSGIVKLKATRAPELLTVEEQYELEHPPWLLRIARAYRTVYSRLRRPRWRPGYGPTADDSGAGPAERSRVVD